MIKEKENILFYGPNENSQAYKASFLGIVDNFAAGCI